jgi:hypothetical protein
MQRQFAEGDVLRASTHEHVPQFAREYPAVMRYRRCDSTHPKGLPPDPFRDWTGPVKTLQASAAGANNETVTATVTGNVLEIVLHIDVVTVATSMRLIDTIAASLDRCPCLTTLVECIAGKSRINCTDTYLVWDYAREKNLCRTKLAYVATGREIGPSPAFTERCAGKRGTRMKIFNNREDAMAWLGTTLSWPAA